jgi:glutathione S-transferase
MFKVYHILPDNDQMGGSRNAAKVTIALRELGETFDIVDLNREKDLRPKDSSYRKNVNPNGVTPAIDEDGFLLWESTAILRYLGDTRGSLIGKDAKSKAVVQQWLSWEASTLQATFLEYYFAVLGNYPSEIKNNALQKYFEKLSILDKTLEAKSGYVADEYSMADIALGMVVPIGFHLEISLENYKSIMSWLNTLSSRAAWQAEPAFVNDMTVGHQKGYLV